MFLSLQVAHSVVVQHPVFSSHPFHYHLNPTLLLPFPVSSLSIDGPCGGSICYAPKPEGSLPPWVHRYEDDLLSKAKEELRVDGLCHPKILYYKGYLSRIVF